MSQPAWNLFESLDQKLCLTLLTFLSTWHSLHPALHHSIACTCCHLSSAPHPFSQTQQVTLSLIVQVRSLEKIPDSFLFLVLHSSSVRCLLPAPSAPPPLLALAQAILTQDLLRDTEMGSLQSPPCLLPMGPQEVT